MSRRASSALLLGLAVFLAAAGQASAKTFTVNSLADTPPNGCTASGCTLREAVLAANANAGKDVVVVKSKAKYVLGLGSAGDDAGTAGDLDVKGPTTVEATNPKQQATIDGGQIDRVFDTTAPLALSGLLVTRGDTSLYSGDGNAGEAIRSIGADLKLDRTTVAGNSGGPSAISQTLGGGVTGSHASVALNGGVGLAESGDGSVVLAHASFTNNAQGAAREADAGDLSLVGAAITNLPSVSAAMEMGDGNLVADRARFDGGTQAMEEFDAGNVSASGAVVKNVQYQGAEEFGPGNLTANDFRMTGGTQALEEFEAGTLSANGAVLKHFQYQGAEEFGPGSVRANDARLTGGSQAIEEFEAGSVSANRTVIKGFKYQGAEEFGGGSVTLNGAKVTGGSEAIQEFDAGDVRANGLELSGAQYEDLQEYGAGSVVLKHSRISGAGNVGIEESDVGGVRLDRSILAANGGYALETYDGGPVKISNSTVTGPPADDASGIYLSSVTGATISGTTISGNHATVDGGGIVAQDSQLRITDSTLAGNSSTGNGGGIAASQMSVVGLNGVTITNNTADSDHDLSGKGGGIYQALGSKVKSENSIVARNHAATDPECSAESATVVSLGHNLIADPEGCGLSTKHDFVAGNPKLGKLADNGGPTKTVALKAGSPAIGHADKHAPARDQRGLKRDSKPDIGAFER